MKRYQDGGTNGTKGQGKLGPALGIGTTVGGAAALITKMIVDKVKSKKAAKAEEEKKKAADAAKKMTMQKMGGATKYKMGGMKKAQDGTAVKSGMPSVAKSSGAAQDLYNNDPSVRTYTNEFTGSKIPTGPMNKEDYYNATERAGVMRAKAL